jgi:hypothetical protein
MAKDVCGMGGLARIYRAGGNLEPTILSLCAENQLSHVLHQWVSRTNAQFQKIEYALQGGEWRAFAEIFIRRRP